MSLYILACRVLQSMIEPFLQDKSIPATFMEYGYHRTPELMTVALQEQLDRVPEASVVIVGYGLCGNGLAGLKSGIHTLIIPRVDDCITLLLGSYQSYITEFTAEPGTYYLTKGWLESGSHPLKEYRDLLGRYDKETADWIIDEQYRNYRRIVLVAPNQEELDAYRNKAREVADFCTERWNYRYEERIGSDEYVKELMTDAFQLTESTEDFLVIPPGGEVKQEMFWR
ncbi:MAG: hypothetical protein A2Z71_11255 [Chloroflexi bacterium RBG_13_50_21]|nr:MAG: hypothetical protein A2Z71_11255 [Chloroflexi bacterium RBG_13_50_21]